MILYKGFDLLKEEKLTGLDSMGYMFEHKKTKARICYIASDDDNKVFYIGFRTPPKDSTGVAHIVEHTVLCGSDKYPVKDPFVELVKGSLNTFLNAITYPDKTVYPIASTNKRDYMNLVDVYMDAVFHPNIYKYREIFEQEGWHYEMEDEDSELTINGVVYNEMKGAYSSPEDVLSRQILNSLFPDTTYAIESGGDPKVIPSLTYEEYLDFHSKYYHPSNSYIYIYGDVDINDMLEYLDKNYLSAYDYLQVDSEIGMQESFAAPRELQFYYSIAADADEEDATYLSYNVCLGDVLCPDYYRAFDVLNYALVSAPGAPLYQALVDSGICEDVDSSLESSQRQMFLSIVAKGANLRDKDRFVSIIEDTLRQQLENGIDKKTILAGINAAQFRARELDFGTAPKGLIIGLTLLDSWLYDKNQPFMHMHMIEAYDEIKSRVNDGFFDYLADTYILNNNHKSIVVLSPKKGLTAIEDEKLKAELAAKKDTMSQSQIKEIVEHTAFLKAYQEEPSPKEDLEKIPMLSRGDLTREARKLDLEEYTQGNTKLLHHNINTSGIHYLNMVFDISDVSDQDLPYVALLERIIGLVDTKNYSYNDLNNEIHLHTGGICTNINMYDSYAKKEDLKITFEVRAKFLFEEWQVASELIMEMLLASDFSDIKRLGELITAEKSHMEVLLNTQGNILAATRARRGFSRRAYLSDKEGGLDFYRFLCELEADFDSNSDEVISRLNNLCGLIFEQSRLLISSTGNNQALEQSRQLIDLIYPKLHSRRIDFVKANHFRRYQVKEALKDASQIQYVAKAGDFSQAGFNYNGAFRLLNTILGYDYFWIKVRVQGGAYGCNMSCGRTGELVFVSYRDPNLAETVNVFDATADYLRDFDVDDREMTKYIIGTVSSMDTPLTPSMRGMRGLSAYMTGITYEVLQNDRNQVLNASCEDIRALADVIDACMKQGHLCVVGNETAIEENKELFDKIEGLM